MQISVTEGGFSNHTPLRRNSQQTVQEWRDQQPVPRALGAAEAGRMVVDADWREDHLSA